MFELRPKNTAIRLSPYNLSAIVECPELVEGRMTLVVIVRSWSLTIRMQDKYYVYILECSDGSYYVGSTNDVGERLERHNAGIAAAWTKDRRPVKLVSQEEHGTLLEARQREEQIKGWTRKKKENLIKGIWKKQ